MPAWNFLREIINMIESQLESELYNVDRFLEDRVYKNACQIIKFAVIWNVRIEASSRETLGSEFAPPCDALYAHL